jgi:hypothetical protein
LDSRQGRCGKRVKVQNARCSEINNRDRDIVRSALTGAKLQLGANGLERFVHDVDLFRRENGPRRHFGLTISVREIAAVPVIIAAETTLRSRFAEVRPVTDVV